MKPNPVKILFCQPTLARSGSENSLLALLEGLERWEGKGRVRVLAGEDGPMRENLARFAVLQIVDAPKLRRNLAGALRFLRSFPRVHAAIKASDCDLVYVNTLMFPQAYLAGFLNRKPVVVHLREVETTYGRCVYFCYYLLARICARHLVAACDFIFRQKTAAFINRLFPRRRRSVIHNWSWAAPAKIVRRVRDKAAILAVIPMSRRKGIFDLIEFAARLRELHPPIPFTIHVVGRTSEAAEVVKAYRMRQALNLEDVLVFCGERERGALAEFYARADLLVQPSHTEAFPRVVVEALAFSLPCVVTAVGGTPEAVEDGRNGYLVPVGKPEEMARRVLELLTHEETYGAFSRQAYATYQSRFAQPAMIGNVIAVLERECRGQ